MTYPLIKTSEWQHEGKNVWSLWDLVERSVPVPEFIRQQAKGKMKMSQGQIWEYVRTENWLPGEQVKGRMKRRIGRIIRTRGDER